LFNTHRSLILYKIAPAPSTFYTLSLHDALPICINIADSPMARVRMGCIAMARLIQDHLGLETIIHFTTRDRNLMALQSELLGARSEEHTSELQSRFDIVCRLLLEKKNHIHVKPF